MIETNTTLLYDGLVSVSRFSSTTQMRDKQLEKLVSRIDAFAEMCKKNPERWRDKPLEAAAWINRGLRYGGRIAFDRIVHCGQCGEIFFTLNAKQIFCDDRCAEAARYQRRMETGYPFADKAAKRREKIYRARSRSKSQGKYLCDCGAWYNHERAFCSTQCARKYNREALDYLDD
jgi:hypothetical protein